MVFITPHSDHQVKTDKEIAVTEFRKVCRKRGADDMFERPSKIMRLELRNNQNEIGYHIEAKDLECVRKAMYHERRKTVPKLPKTRQETHTCFDASELKSTRDEDMIKVNDAETGIVIFSTRSNLELLCSRGAQVFGVGTFQTCPSVFYQLYVLHVFKHGQYVPCVFALLPSKTELVNRQMLSHIRTYVMQQRGSRRTASRYHSPGFGTSDPRSGEGSVAADFDQRVSFSSLAILVSENQQPWSLQ